MRSHKELHLQGGADWTDDLILTNTVLHAMLVIVSLKLGDHEGLTFFIHVWLLKRTLLVVLPAILNLVFKYSDSGTRAVTILSVKETLC